MSCTVPVKNLELYAGDSCELPFAYKDVAGFPIRGILSATITLRLTYNGPAIISKGATIDEPNGTMLFTFSGTETASLVSTSSIGIPHTKYLQDVQLEMSSGVTPITVIRGDLIVTGDITR
jgi:hypothetical protein